MKILDTDFQTNPRKEKVKDYFTQQVSQYWVSIRDVVDDLEMKRTTVRKVLLELIKEEFIETKKRKNSENNGVPIYYRLNPNRKGNKKSRRTKND